MREGVIGHFGVDFLGGSVVMSFVVLGVGAAGGCDCDHGDRRREN